MRDWRMRSLLRVGPSSVRAQSILRHVAAGLYAFNSVNWLRRGETSFTRWLWALSILVFAASFIRLPLFRASRTERPDDLRRLPAGLLLGAIVAVAFALRFVNLTNVPLDVHGDFASVGLEARELLDGRVSAIVATGWYDEPMLAFVQPALTMWIFGDNLFGMNMEAVILGTATVIGIYLLAQLLFGRSTGLVAAAISAIGYADIHFSRVSAYIDPVPWLVFGFYFLLLGLRVGGEWRAGLAGALMAIGFEMYYSGRLAVVVVALFLLYLGLFQRRVLFARRRDLVFFLCAGLIVTGPMLLFHVRHPDVFLSRTRQVFVLAPGNMAHLLGKYNTDSPLRVLVEQIWRSLLMFNYTQDTSTQFGFGHPLLNPALGPLFVLGSGLTVWRLRRPGNAFLAIWLATGVVLGSILTIDAPFWPRLVVILPCVSILTAVGLTAGLRSLLSLVNTRARPEPMLLPASALIIAAVGYQNWQWYYHGSESRLAAPIAWVGRLIAKSPPGTGYCMVRGPLSFADRVPQFLGKGHEMLDIPPEELEGSMKRCVAEGRVWIILRPDHDPVLASLDREWPAARRVRHDYPSGEPGPIFWYPPPGDSLQCPGVDSSRGERGGEGGHARALRMRSLEQAFRYRANPEHDQEPERRYVTHVFPLRIARTIRRAAASGVATRNIPGRPNVICVSTNRSS